MLHANQSNTALDRVIAAAEAFLPEYRRIDEADTAAQEAAYEIDRAMADQKKAATLIADQVAPRPDILSFRRDDESRILKMGFRFASGRESWTDLIEDEFYLPDTRDSLIRHCSDKGLDPQPYLTAWDSWKAAHEEAFFKAMPKEWRDAEVAEEEARAEWSKASRHLEQLGRRVLRARVRTPADLLKKLEAYVRICEISTMEIDEIEDASSIMGVVTKGLRSMPVKATARPQLQLVA